MVDAHGLSFHIDNRLILLLHQHGHFLEHLSELGQCLFDLLNLEVTFLNLSVSSSSGTVSVRVEQLPLVHQLHFSNDSQLAKRPADYHSR